MPGKLSAPVQRSGVSPTANRASDNTVTKPLNSQLQLAFETYQKQVQAISGASTEQTDSTKQVAAQGVQGTGSRLPHLDAIQACFGHHDVSTVQAHVGGEAGKASEAIGASAYAMGNDVAFKNSPDLHTAAHEAAHVVQQRAGVHLQGGVGQPGDVYEQHADAVADKVVQGQSAADVLSSSEGKSSSVGGSLQQCVQMDMEGFRSMPTPRDLLFAEIADMSAEDKQTLLLEMGTEQERGELWSGLERRYRSGTGQLVYDRLTERRDALGGGQPGSPEPAPNPSPSEEGEDAEVINETLEDIHVDLQNSDFFSEFVRQVQQRVATLVQSRTRGPNGSPVRREVPLLTNNASLRRVFDTIIAAYAESDETDVFHNLIAAMHWSTSRVEEITFTVNLPEPPSPPPLPAPTDPDTIIDVQIGVGGLTYQQLTSNDPNVIRSVGDRFLDTLIQNTRGHGNAMTIMNVPEDYLHQIRSQLMALEDPGHSVPLLVEATVHVTRRPNNETWPCRVTGLTARVSSGGIDIQPEPVPGAPVFDWRSGWTYLWIAWQGVRAGLAPARVIGSFITAGQMAWEIIDFQFNEWRRWATTQGFWDALGHEPPAPCNHERHGFMNETARRPENRAEVQRRYDNAHVQGVAAHGGYDELWRAIEQQLRQSDNEQQRQAADVLSQSENRTARDEVIARCLRDTHNTYDLKKQFVDDAIGL